MEKEEDIRPTVAFALMIAAVVLYALHAVDYFTGLFGGKSRLFIPALILTIVALALKATTKKKPK